MYAYFICRALHSNNCSSELHYPMILLLVRSAIKWQGSLEVILSILIGWFFLGWDFTIQTISIRTIIFKPCLF